MKKLWISLTFLAMLLLLFPAPAKASEGASYEEVTAAVRDHFGLTDAALKKVSHDYTMATSDSEASLSYAISLILSLTDGKSSFDRDALIPYDDNKNMFGPVTLAEVKSMLEEYVPQVTGTVSPQGKKAVVVKDSAAITADSSLLYVCLPDTGKTASLSLSGGSITLLRADNPKADIKLTRTHADELKMTGEAALTLDAGASVSELTVEAGGPAKITGTSGTRISCANIGEEAVVSGALTLTRANVDFQSVLTMKNGASAEEINLFPDAYLDAKGCKVESLAALGSGAVALCDCDEKNVDFDLYSLLLNGKVLQDPDAVSSDYGKKAAELSAAVKMTAPDTKGIFAEGYPKIFLNTTMESGTPYARVDIVCKFTEKALKNGPFNVFASVYAAAETYDDTSTAEQIRRGITILYNSAKKKTYTKVADEIEQILVDRDREYLVSFDVDRVDKRYYSINLLAEDTKAKAMTDPVRARVPANWGALADGEIGRWAGVYLNKKRNMVTLYYTPYYLNKNSIPPISSFTVKDEDDKVIARAKKVAVQNPGTMFSRVRVTLDTALTQKQADSAFISYEAPRSSKTLQTIDGIAFSDFRQWIDTPSRLYVTDAYFTKDRKTLLIASRLEVKKASQVKLTIGGKTYACSSVAPMRNDMYGCYLIFKAGSGTLVDAGAKTADFTLTAKRSKPMYALSGEKLTKIKGTASQAPERTITSATFELGTGYLRLRQSFDEEEYGSVIGADCDLILDSVTYPCSGGSLPGYSPDEEIGYMIPPANTRVIEKRIGPDSKLTLVWRDEYYKIFYPGGLPLTPGKVDVSIEEPEIDEEDYD